MLPSLHRTGFMRLLELGAQRGGDGGVVLGWGDVGEGAKGGGARNWGVDAGAAGERVGMCGGMCGDICQCESEGGGEGGGCLMVVWQ